MSLPSAWDIVRALGAVRYKVVGPCEPCDVLEPRSILRIVSVTGDTITVDGYIEDPGVSDFFVVLKPAVERDRWICFYRDQYVITYLVSSGFNRFSIPLIKKCYPPL